MSPQTIAVRSSQLVGRSRELAEMVESVASVPLTTLTGPGGVGKTALRWRSPQSRQSVFPMV